MSEQQTTRQMIADFLRTREYATPSMIAEHVNYERPHSPLRPEQIVTEVEHVHESLDGTEQVLVTAPRCKDCGFDEFEKRANIPSKCPECYGTWIEEPDFTIEGTESVK